MYWDVPDREVNAPEDPQLQKAFTEYLDSTEYLIDLTEAVEELINKNPSLFAEFVIDQMMDIELSMLMVEPEKFGESLREDVERALVNYVSEDVEQAWIERYEDERRDRSNFH